MTLGVSLPMLLGVLLGLRCNIGILLIVLVPALIVIAGVEAPGMRSAQWFSPRCSAPSLSRPDIWPALGCAAFFRVLGLRVAPEAEAVH
jgi:hypothetical protein